MSLNTIPVELLEIVLKHCEAPQICNLRLSCRRISEVADEHFLQSTTLFFVREDFDTIEQIVQQKPRIANSLAHVTFQTDHLRPLHEYGSWKRLRDLSQVTIEDNVQSIPEATLQLSNKPVGWRFSRRPDPDPAFDQYTRQWHDQESLYQEKRAYTCFQRLFTICPKLDNILIATGPDHGRLQSWKSVEAFRRGIVGPKGANYHGYVNSDLTKAVTRAARDSGKEGLKSLAVEPLSFMYFDTAGAFDVASALHNLESLRLNVSEGERRSPQSQTDDERLRDDRGIAKFLRQAPNLRCLDIASSGSRITTSLDSFIDQAMIWPHLSVLALNTFETTAKNFVALLSRHRETLQTLRLCDVVFSGDADLRTCLLPVAGQLSKLKVVDLKGRFVAEPAHRGLQLLQFREGNNAAVMERYILEGGQLPTHYLVMQGSFEM